MIMINGNWETVDHIPDIIRIAEENVGREFAMRIEEICCSEPSEEMLETNQRLNAKLDELESVQDECDKMKNNIKRLREFIQENDNGSAHIRSMKIALNMIEGD